MSAPVTAPPPSPAVVATEAPATLWQIAWRQIRRNRLALFCLGIIVCYTGIWAYAEGVYWYYRLAQQPAPYKAVEFNNRFATPVPRPPPGHHAVGRDALPQVARQ